MGGYLLGFRVFLTSQGSINHDGHFDWHVVEKVTFFSFLCSTLVALSFITIGLQANRRPINSSSEGLFELFLSSLSVSKMSSICLSLFH